MLNLNSILCDAAPAAGGQAGGQAGWTSWIFIIAIIAIFYFMMIRPQQKRQKKLAAERAALSEGAKVITAGGIHGKIVDVKENTFVISIADGVRITVEKNSVYPGVADLPQQ
ncbi:MAG: preprotein translocase subunit YajC [Muribaculaceae bacterium]|nr:preprotein translocase subunit YajC [Muribaculaceae bacterium]MDE7393389.1 preprotein translocase subunit YajC [Muribaculaceae bacterium]